MRMKPVAVVVLTCLAAVALPASADPRRSHVQGAVHGHRRFDGHHHRHHRHHHHHGFRHRAVLPFFVGPSVVLASPVVVAPAPIYAPPPVYAAPPVYVAPPPLVSAAPAMPRVVEFPTGRYELRGDGLSTPYTWVWIPNPPVAPPPPPAPMEAPAPSGAPEPRPARARTVMLYRWTDEQGVTTWTDNLEKVPARHRAQAGRLAP
jgi:hypothetical protein